MATPHYFIAIPLPIALKVYFSKWQKELKQQLRYKQWPDKHDLHITLKFLGAVDEESLHKLDSALEQAVDTPAFSTEVGTVGTFGKPTQPRVLWAGVNHAKNLTLLQQQVEQAAQEVGFKKESRPYRPHITLAKKWDGLSVQEVLEDIGQQYKMDKQILPVNEFVLYRIYPNKVPKYEIVYRYYLHGGEQDGPVD